MDQNEVWDLTQSAAAPVSTKYNSLKQRPKTRRAFIPADSVAHK